MTLVVGNVLCVRPAGRAIALHASSMSKTSDTVVGGQRGRGVSVTSAGGWRRAPLPQITSRPAVPVSVSLRSVPRMVHAGVEADAVPEVRRAAENAARRRSREVMSIRAMPSLSARTAAFPWNRVA